MTSNIFGTELRQWGKNLKLQSRKIALLVDVTLKEFKWVLMRLHKNAKLQLMNQGVIHLLKWHYRKILLLIKNVKYT